MTPERITAPKVDKKMDDHLQEHVLKWNYKLHDVWHAMFGEKGKGGLCNEVNDMKIIVGNIDKRLGGIEDMLKWLVRLIIGAVILAVLGLVIIKG